MHGENPEYAEKVIREIVERWDELVGKTEDSQNDE